MKSERDIYAAANTFIQRFGDAAARAAAMQADEYGETNQFKRQQVWIRLVKAINELQRARSPEEALN